MSSTYLTRNAILKGVSAVYLMAFVSLYIQIPGLYGVSGLLPAHLELEARQPPELPPAAAALLWLRGRLALNTQHALEAVALAGAALALLGVLLELFRTSLVYLGLLLAYALLTQVGQVFFLFQGDTLLLEAGLLAALLAPLLPWRRAQPADALGMLLVRWLLFRLTFASGMLKLLGGGPAWWGLTALETLFENHWLPTPLSWVAHQLPAPALRAVLVAVLVAQIAVPVLFFAPVRQLRLFAFWTQVALQVAAMLTGNCSFYHILVIVLCLSLVDDDWLQGRRQAGAGVPGLLATLATLVVYGALLLGAVFLFELRLDYGGLAARTAFTKSDFEEFAQKAVPGSIALGAAAFLLAAAEALTSALMDSPGLCSALDAIWKTLVSVAVAALVFGVSLVPFSSLDAATQGALPTLLRDVAGPLQQHRLLGQYGLFHELAGAGGRRELILEGAHSASGPWKEIEFKYKPGDVAAAPSFASPHQPRLDWQMSLAAAGKLSDNPWMSALAYRLLTGQAEVIRLLDVKRYPFVAKPPKYVRAMKHGYKFTGWKGGDGSWWSRSDIRQDYLPVYTAQDKALLELLTSRKIIGHPEQAKEDSWLVGLLEQLRRFFDHWEPARLVWAVLLACWAVDLTRGRPWYR